MKKVGDTEAGGRHMDPITLIVTALVAGVANTANQAVKDAYNGLKTLILRKFADKPKAQEILADHEQDPETYEKPLKKALTEAHLEEDQAILEAAQRVMTLVQPQQAAMGKYNVQITGNVQGFAQGDHQQVTMNFGNAPKEQ